MPSTDERRYHRSKSKSTSQTSRSRKQGQDHGGGTTLGPPSLDQPATLETLRRARLDHIETPASVCSEKMKYEYTRTVPVKAKAATPELSSKQRSSKRVRKRRSIELDKPRKASSQHDSREDSAVSSGDDEDEDPNGATYVYRSSQRPTASGHRNMVKTPGRGKEEDGARSGAKGGKQAQARRHTLQTHAKVQAPEINTERTNLSSPRRRLSRSNTAPSTPVRPSLRATTGTLRTKSEVSSARPTSGRKATGVLGAFFSPKPPPPPEPKVSCLTCGDDLVKARTAKLPCSHRMCHPCLKRIFKLSITDPAHMPPRCCTDQHIDLQHVDKLFDHDFKKTWNKKFKEYKAKNRIYCPKTGCGQWIQPKHMTIEKGRKTGKCPTCKMLVCGICNQKMHKSRDCPKDPLTKQFAEIAKESGWQKCYNCSATVELKEGCNHMTCRCTAEFCMVCGLKWKSCDCPWFNYDRVELNGDPIRYQQELDRRREQEHRDEEIARRLVALDVNGAFATTWGFGTLRPNPNNNGNNANRNNRHNSDDDDDDDSDDMDRIWAVFGRPYNRNNNRNNRNNGNVTAVAAAARANPNFLEQAREALTANYQVADHAARGLLNGLFTGRDDIEVMPPPISQLDGTPEAAAAAAAPPRPPASRPRIRRPAAQDPAEETILPIPGTVPVVRRPTRRRRHLTNTTDDLGNRVQTDAQRDQERRMRRWADDDPAD